ncbi:hypothetical protein BPOR_0461g00010 [Botrytis porri]|uniref:Uncharacterized protein n=1 Tax=Botrytis porri TaxID=87229 RepID=A0A4Z1KGZ2_9HELO|nr:hypothetical protein BPOR_0461g00010 [Botrytis porri]
MSIQWSTTSSGSWDEKYPQLKPGNRGLPSTSLTEPIVYPENPGDTYIMKPVSHSWADVSEMILHCVHSSSQDIESHPIHNQLYQSIGFDQDLSTVLVKFMEIYNVLFFGGMVKSSVVENSADDEYEIIFNLELVSNGTRAEKVELYNDLGLTTGSLDGRSNSVTIYIRDGRILQPNWDFCQVISEMLGTLAHEMIRAMQFMYTKCPGCGLGIEYAMHGTNFQKVAQAIEQATRDPSGGKGWIYPKIELGREWGVYYDIKEFEYKEPTDMEIRNMRFDVEYLRKILRLPYNPRRVGSIDQPSDFN